VTSSDTHQAQPRLDIVPLSLADANRFVEKHHRHHGKLTFYKFAIGVVCDRNVLRGVAIVGRPVARNRDDGFTAEVGRLATDGCPNACSKLLAASWRIARAMGYRRLGTYTLAEEPGTSLDAAGWKLIYTTKGGSGWARHSRPGRSTAHPGPKKLYEAPPPSGKP
jgi:hypothetical protein